MSSSIDMTPATAHSDLKDAIMLDDARSQAEHLIAIFKRGAS